MRRRLTIEVKDAKEFEAIQRGLADPETRAFLVIVGTLLPMPERARARVLAFVADQVAEDLGEKFMVGNEQALESLAAISAAARRHGFRS